MVISASRRTDIPCYYSEWFLNRLMEGYVLTRNPMNYSQISHVSLAKEDVDCIVFWTKDAENIMAKLDKIEELGHKYCFQYTITPYGNDLETNLRPKEKIIENFIRLSEKIGKQRVVWRYDPILVTESFSAERHAEEFSKMCSVLSDYTERVIISFVDTYKKLRNKNILEVCEADVYYLAKEISEVCEKNGISVQSCCEKYELSKFGIEKGGCIDLPLIEKVLGHDIKINLDKGQRTDCKCVKSKDIGVYNTCTNGCVYCYANHSTKSILANYEKHNPKSEFML